ncbi:MAG: glucosaminidase domain-containing protein [Proteobacteria bacterium]|nr:glucosaminidase domain-containing protein [Pseudomonadota bacterium]
MLSQSKKYIAVLITLALILTGIVFGTDITKSTTQTTEQQLAKEPTDTPTANIKLDSSDTHSAEVLAEIALINADIGVATGPSPEKTELEIIRDSIDWSDAPSPAPELVKTDDYDVFINVTSEYLMYVFDKVGFTGENLDSGETVAIPPLIVVSISKGWADDQTVQFKKNIFYRVILALLLYENEDILREREELLTILEAAAEGGSFSAEQSNKLHQLAYSYRVIKEDSKEPLTEEQIQELLKRVDMVPPSLGLAQAAHESGYATSRFAHTGNALFGQWDWSAKAIKPKQQRKGMGNYGIKSFDQPVDSVRSYYWNLNTHRSYAMFRTQRAIQRGQQRGRVVLDGEKLAGTLTSYSERGKEYTEELKSTIRFNRLERADKLRLMEGKAVYFN